MKKLLKLPIFLAFLRFLGKVTKTVNKHHFKSLGDALCYHQPSRLGQCVKCHLIVFVPMSDKDFSLAYKHDNRCAGIFYYLSNLDNNDIFDYIMIKGRFIRRHDYKITTESYLNSEGLIKYYKCTKCGDLIDRNIHSSIKMINVLGCRGCS